MQDDRNCETASATAPEEASARPHVAAAPPAQPAAADPLAGLRGEWGEHYDDNVGIARQLVGEIASPELITALDRSGLGDNPHLIRALVATARRIYQGASPGVAETERIKKRLDALHVLQYANDPAKRMEYRSKPVQGELRRLYAALYGDAPATGLRHKN
jgi:hypothetical protein